MQYNEGKMKQYEAFVGQQKVNKIKTRSDIIRFSIFDSFKNRKLLDFRKDSRFFFVVNSRSFSITQNRILSDPTIIIQLYLIPDIAVGLAYSLQEGYFVF